MSVTASGWPCWITQPERLSPIRIPWKASTTAGSRPSWAATTRSSPERSRSRQWRVPITRFTLRATRGRISFSSSRATMLRPTSRSDSNSRPRRRTASSRRALSRAMATWRATGSSTARSRAEKAAASRRPRFSEPMRRSLEYSGTVATAAMRASAISSPADGARSHRHHLDAAPVFGEEGDREPVEGHEAPRLLRDDREDVLDGEVEVHRVGDLVDGGQALGGRLDLVLHPALAGDVAQRGDDGPAAFELGRTCTHADEQGLTGAGAQPRLEGGGRGGRLLPSAIALEQLPPLLGGDEVGELGAEQARGRLADHHPRHPVGIGGAAVLE